jgi:hypothetical protein
LSTKKKKISDMARPGGALKGNGQEQEKTKDEDCLLLENIRAWAHCNFSDIRKDLRMLWGLIAKRTLLLLPEFMGCVPPCRTEARPFLLLVTVMLVVLQIKELLGFEACNPFIEDMEGLLMHLDLWPPSLARLQGDAKPLILSIIPSILAQAEAWTLSILHQTSGKHGHPQLILARSL